MTPPVGHYLVVAPHPDDEVLTVGGLICQAVRAGSDVAVLAVTDGGNAYPSRFDHDVLAAVRGREQHRALCELGVAGERVHSLGFRDGDVAERENELVERICALADPMTTIVAPWTSDVHADHEAVGRAAAVAASRTGCSIWFSLFWAWHHADPASLDDAKVICVELDHASQQTKQAALQRHTSQLRPVGIEPMLDVATLEPARWGAEYFIVGWPVSGTR